MWSQPHKMAAHTVLVCILLSVITHKALSQIVNPNPPSFHYTPYRISQPENLPINSLIFDPVVASDPDNGYSAKVSFLLTDDFEGLFNISTATLNTSSFSYTTNVSLEKNLDYEDVSFYRIPIMARDYYGKNVTTEIQLTVVDVQDTPPIFQSKLQTAFKENINLATTVLHVDVTDGDRDAIPQHAINLTISRYVPDDIPCRNFVLEPTTSSSAWIIVNNGDIDRDTDVMDKAGGICNLEIKAQELNHDGSLVTVNGITWVNVTLTIEDEDDNPPMFGLSQYTASVYEDMEAGIPINIEGGFINVTDKDQASNAQFDLSVQQNGNQFGNFTLIPDTGISESIVLVRTAVKFDYEEIKSVTFQIMATSSHNKTISGFTTINLQIIDQNDNSPEFNGAPYNTSIYENAINGTFVIDILAQDKDSGSYGTITYDLRYDRAGCDRFHINATSGRVSTTGALDREEEASCLLTIDATDGGGRGSSAELTVRLLDINDKSPNFDDPIYRAFIDENEWDFLSEFVVTATDDDEANTLNSLVRYNLTWASDRFLSSFGIQPDNGTISIVTPLDYEDISTDLLGKVTLEVTACDMGTPSLCTSINASIEVTDMNDNAPNFTEANYNVTILETATSGIILNISATDKDGTFPNNKIFYQINRGALDMFLINFNDGNLSVAQGATFDRDQKFSYALTVQGIDRGQPERSGNCTVLVIIADVNNKKPFFDPQSTDAKINESQPLGSIVTSVTAKDTDLDSDLVYSLLINDTTAIDENGATVPPELVKDYFDVYDNGTVYVKSALDRETAKTVLVKIKVTDENAIDPPVSEQTATGTVVITIEDTNDFPPVFGRPSYHFNVTEEGKIGDWQGDISATDQDENKTIMFNISSVTIPFKIESTGDQSAVISLTSVLDREVLDTHTFEVLAFDSGVPSRTSSVNVTITVVDINDNSPVFLTHNMTYHVSEDASIDYVVAIINATDKDIGPFGTIFYTFDNGANQDGSFGINDSTGEITVIGSLDREQTSTYTLHLVATDNRAADAQNQKSGQTSVVIMIDDVNDNYPEFSKMDTADIRENDPVDTTVITVTAQDADEGHNAILTYSFESGGNSSSFFRIEPNTGSILVNVSLKDRVGVWFVIVKATDQGTEPKSNSTDVFINVIDVNNNDPQFVEPAGNVVNVLENKTKDDVIFKVSATDADHGSNADVTFEITDNALNFSLTDNKENSANVITKVKFERHLKDSYTLTIKATDSGPEPRSAFATITVRLQDLNLHPPVFESGPASFSVEEGRAPQAVGTVTANDFDVGNNSLTCYRILNGTWSSFFAIEERTGAITLIKSVDREVIHIVKIEVKAKDCVSNAEDATLSTLAVNVAVEDINDNPPIFKDSKSYDIGITKDTQFDTVIYNLMDQVTDEDSANNSVHFYYESRLMEVSSELLSEYKPTDRVFNVTKAGQVVTNIYFKDLSGYFTLYIVVNDTDKNNDHATLTVYLINAGQRAKIIIRDNTNAVALIKDELMKELTRITEYIFVADKIETHKDLTGTADATKTDLYVHAKDPETGEVVNADELLKLIDFNTIALTSVFNKYNILSVEKSSTAEASAATDSARETYILTGVLAVVIASLVIIIGLFCLSNKRLKRKLMAASIDVYNGDKKAGDLQMLQVPGANIHNYDNVNPIYNEDLPDHKGSISDTDSLSSLDEEAFRSQDNNSVDEQEVAIDVFGDDNYAEIDSKEEPTAFLNAALAEHIASMNERNSQRSAIGNMTNDLIAANGHVPVSAFALETTEV